MVRALAAAHPETRIHLLMRRPDQALFADLACVTVHQYDLTQPSGLAGLVRRLEPQAIVHCAASGVRPPGIDWFDQIGINVSATVALFQASCEVAGCHFVHVSTGLVYASQPAGVRRACSEHDPIDTLHPYGASKAAADCLLRAGAERLRRPLTVVRPFSFTGLHDGGDRLFPSLLRATAAGEPLPMSPATQVRDFCAVDDIASAIVLLLERGAPAHPAIYNLGSGQSVALGELVAEVCCELKLHTKLLPGARPFHPYEPLYLVADIAEARALGWRPRTRLAYAVWQLARSQFPELAVTEPAQHV